MKNPFKVLFRSLGFNPVRLLQYSLKKVIQENKWERILHSLEDYVPDISEQEISEDSNCYIVLKRRLMHVFQFDLMNRLLNMILRSSKENNIVVVDIGDSAGTHMMYLKKAYPEKNIRTISVNLCPEEVSRIRAKGMEAVLCRAERLDLKDTKVSFFTSFEMVEHLHNPAIFFKRLAEKANSDYMVITVPYLNRSRVGLHRLKAIISNGTAPEKKIIAEEEHIFEFSPSDWELLILHSGWQVIERKIYYQYPNIFPIKFFLRNLWRRLDYEGFLGLILKREPKYMDIYQDWED